MDASYYERKKRYLLNLYPDIEEGLESEDDEKKKSSHHERDSSLKREGSASSSTTTDEDDSIGSLSSDGGETRRFPYHEKSRRPFWVPYINRQKSKETDTTSKGTSYSQGERRPTSDASPMGINPDPECQDEDQGKRTFSFYVLLLSSLLLVGLATAIVVLSLVLVNKNKSSSNNLEGEPTLRVYPGHARLNGGPCDISEIESICRLNEGLDELLLEQIPKCVQDSFQMVYVRTGTDEFFKYTVDLLKSCSSEGMALKRLAAREHEESTSGLLNCEYFAYKWYYKLGHVEWWTPEGARQTEICERDSFYCTGHSPDVVVDAFVTDLGEDCLLSTLSL